MDRSRLLNWTRQRVLSVSNFTDSDGSHRLYRAWLTEAADPVEDERGHVNQGRNRPAAAGLFFDFSDGRSTITIFNVSLSPFGWQTTGRCVVADRLERLPLPLKSFLQGGWVGLGRGEQHLRYFWRGA